MKRPLLNTESAVTRFFPIYILGFGVVIRLYACFHTYIINPDGVLYVYQARAITSGYLSALTRCGISYVSNYPFFIALAHFFTNDWILAARAVSFVFGAALLAPLFLMLKRFFNTTVSALAVLVYASIPVLVGRSADIVRGPVCWFFLVSGMYFFIGYKDRPQGWRLTISCILYLAAAWARIEALVYIVVSFLFLLCFEKKKKVKSISAFIAPFVVIAPVCIIAIISFDVPLSKILRWDDVLSKLTGPVAEYQHLREALRELSHQQRGTPLEFFLPIVRNLVWFIPLGALLNNFLEALFYPYVMIFLIGLIGAAQKIRSDGRILYFSLLAVFSTVLLYVHMIQTWMIFYRFMAIVIFPLAVFIGFGIEKINDFLQNTCRLKPYAAAMLIVVAVIAAGLPKNLEYRGYDKRVFTEIGEYLAKRENTEAEIRTATSIHTHRWIFFYAHLNYKNPPCPQRFELCWENFADRYPAFIHDLKRNDMGYFLWEEKHWPKTKFQISQIDPRHLKALKTWEHPDTGTMILFEVK